MELQDSDGNRFRVEPAGSSLGIVDEGGGEVAALPVPSDKRKLVGVVGGQSIQWLEYENLCIWSPERDEIERVPLDRGLTPEAAAPNADALFVMARSARGTGIFRVASDGSTRGLLSLRKSPSIHERRLEVVAGYVVWALGNELCCMHVDGDEEFVLDRVDWEQGFEIMGSDTEGRLKAARIEWRSVEYGMRMAERQEIRHYDLPDDLAGATKFAAEPVPDTRKKPTHPAAPKRLDQIGSLSPRILKALENANIHTVGQLAIRTHAELRKIRSIGPGAMDELESVLEDQGLHLGMAIDEMGLD